MVLITFYHHLLLLLLLLLLLIMPLMLHYLLLLLLLLKPPPPLNCLFARLLLPFLLLLLPLPLLPLPHTFLHNHFGGLLWEAPQRVQEQLATWKGGYGTGTQARQTGATCPVHDACPSHHSTRKQHDSMGQRVGQRS